MYLWTILFSFWFNNTDLPCVWIVKWWVFVSYLTISPGLYKVCRVCLCLLICNSALYAKDKHGLFTTQHQRCKKITINFWKGHGMDFFSLLLMDFFFSLSLYSVVFWSFAIQMVIKIANSPELSSTTFTSLPL